MTSAKLALQKAIKSLLESAMPAVPAVTDPSECSALPYTVIGADTEIDDSDKSYGAGELTHSMTTWAGSQVQAKQNAAIITSVLTNGDYVIDAPHVVECAYFDFSGPTREDELAGVKCWGIPLRFRYNISH